MCEVKRFRPSVNGFAELELWFSLLFRYGHILIGRYQNKKYSKSMTQALFACNGFGISIGRRSLITLITSSVQIVISCDISSLFSISHIFPVPVVSVPAGNCSFPFTYNGQLLYECTGNVTNVTDTCNLQRACLLEYRNWAVCTPPAGDQRPV